MHKITIVRDHKWAWEAHSQEVANVQVPAGKSEEQNVKIWKAWTMSDLITIIAKCYMVKIIHIRMQHIINLS